jgi:hypothetical protein
MFTLEEFVANERTPIGDARAHVIDGGALQNSRFDPGLRRAYLEEGQAWVDVNVGRKLRVDDRGAPVLNASGNPIFDPIYEPQLVSQRIANGQPVLPVNNATTLRKDQWVMLDAAVLAAARRRLRAWDDLRSTNTFGGFDGMATPILEHEIMTDPGEAVADMEGLSEGRNFSPEFALQGLPLPITHSDFHLSQRFLAASSTKGQPQDTLRAAMSGQRVAELIEQTLIGTVGGVTYGASGDYLDTAKVYGYTNHPDRITKTDLTASATILADIATTGGTAFLNMVLDMVHLAYAQNFFGPFVLYTSTKYDEVLEYDFKAQSDKTIRQRVREVDAITDIRRLDYLTGDVLVLVQMTSDVAQAVNGLEITTVQWEEKGGMQLSFKVMAIQVPRIRSVYVSKTTNTVTGIVHGTTS